MFHSFIVTHLFSCHDDEWSQLRSLQNLTGRRGNVGLTLEPDLSLPIHEPGGGGGGGGA